MILVALLGASEASGFSIAQSSAIASAVFASAAFSALWKGRVVDRMGREVIARQALLLLVVFSMLTAAFFWGPWWSALLGAALLGFIRINHAALQQALWSDYHNDKAVLSRALSWENTLSFIAQTLGPLLAALAIWLGGGYAALLLTALLTVGSMLFWGQLAPRGDISQKTSGFIWSLLSPLLAIFLLFSAAGLLQGLVLQEEGGVLLLAVYTFGAGITGFYFFRRSFPLRLWRPALSLGPIALLLASLSFGTTWVVPALLVGGFLFSSASLAANIRIRSLTPPGRMNEAFSAPLMFAPLGMSLGIFLSGTIVALPWLLIIIPIIFSFLIFLFQLNIFSSAPASVLES